ncbi:MAG: hypothetical protein ACD_3C00051G0004 [uncultured bacterium (gcode 4)]|uniref:Uncharacterized protein n=1 Tax=uncultured bacterium (gcode 4) TaxID=1234023 RepID=K2FBJ6_9BACT|nr:MAG: hypothetical protein ACD_3C00051G0004 [uncultured bacterium (gcode 4)]
MSLFRKNDKNVKHGIKKVDAIVTGLVLGWIIASVYWIKKYEQEKHSEVQSDEETQKIAKKSIFKSLFFWTKDREEPKKPSLWRRVLAFPFIVTKRLWKK